MEERNEEAGTSNHFEEKARTLASKEFVYNQPVVYESKIGNRVELNEFWKRINNILQEYLYLSRYFYDCFKTTTNSLTVGFSRFSSSV